MVVQSEVAIEDGAKVLTCAAFLALAKEQFEKIPKYRAKVNEVIEEFAPVDAEYEEIGGKIKAYDKEITASYNEFRAAEEEYAQSCKGL